MCKRKSHMQKHIGCFQNLGPESWLYFAIGRRCCCFYLWSSQYFYTLQRGSLKSWMLLKKNKLKDIIYILGPKHGTSRSRHLNEMSLAFPPLNKCRMICDPLPQPGHLCEPRDGGAHWITCQPWPEMSARAKPVTKDWNDSTLTHSHIVFV